MTAAVLSWVMTCFGWMKTKSPERILWPFGRSREYCCTIFSIRFWGEDCKKKKKEKREERRGRRREDKREIGR